MPIPREYMPEAGSVCLYQGNDFAVLYVGCKMVFGCWLGQEIMVDKREVSRKKTPEQVEEEKAIADIEKVIGKMNWNPDIAKALHEAGYHNQPKVKPISWKEYNSYYMSQRAKDTFDTMASLGIIIEAKEKGQ